MRLRSWLVALRLVAVVLSGLPCEALALNRYWADMQGDNATTGTPTDYYTFARDSVHLDVVMLTAHANTSTDLRWTNVKNAAAAMYVPGSFVPFSGYEWNSDVYGHKVCYFLTDDQPIIRPNAPASTTPAQFYSLFAATNGLCHAAHPSLPTYTTNWNYFDPDLQPNAEMLSRWGIYETSASAKALREVWARGYRVGVVGSSDSHTVPATEGGVTAILASSLDRASILDALRARHNYATNGPRIGLDFKIGGAMMGDMDNSPATTSQIYAKVDCTAPLSRIEVRRSNQLVYTYAPPPARTFVDVGAPLTYFKGTIEPPAGWNAVGFSDAGWFSGRSGIGFGGNDDVTIVTGMQNKYATLYTRQAFTVTDNAPQVLYLGADYDDGFIAYIDGVEVLRANMPAGPVTSTTLASAVRNPNLAAKAVPGAVSAPFYTDTGTAAGVPTAPALDYFNLSSFASLLSPGNHVLSIELHNGLLNSNDLTMIPKLIELDPMTQTTVNFTDNGGTGDRFYDVKVFQIDGGVAWSSPIWLNADAPARPVATLSDTPNDNGTGLELAWTKSVATDFRYYNIYVSDAPFSDAAGIAPWNAQRIMNADSLHARIASFNGAPLQRGKTYYVFVAAADWADKMNTATVGALVSAAPIDNLAPAAPVSIDAIDTPNDDGSSVRVSWSLSPDDGGGANDVQRYEIFRRKASATYGATPLATRLRGTLSYLDNSTLDGTSYFYKVRAHDSFNASPFTAEFGPITSVNNGGLAEPKNVTGSDRPGDQGGWIRLAWSLIPQDAVITRYLVYRSPTPGTYGNSPLGWVPRGTAGFSDSTAAGDTDYYYVVVSDSAGVKRSSTSIDVGPVRALDNLPPAAISALTAANTAQGGAVSLSWSGYPEAAQGDVTYYNVYYKSSSFTSVAGISSVVSVPSGTFAATVTGLTNGTTYFFAVVPSDEAGNFNNTVVNASAKPTDTTAPVYSGLVAATAGDASLRLTWNPARDNSLPITYSLYQSLTPAGFDYTTPAATVAGSNPIVPLGSSWRFLKGTSEPPAGWNQRGFNDAGWLAGEGAFGYDTANRYKPATVLSDMNGVYSTVYFRTNFTLASVPSALAMGLLIDDGYVAYLNGVEVSRDNLTTPLGFASLASTSVNPAWSGTLDPSSPTNYNPNPGLRQVDLSAFTGLLLPGVNTLAFEVHNYKKTNADFLFLAELSQPTVSYTMTGLSPSKTYYYVMRAADAQGNRDANSIVVSGKPLLAPPPVAVTGLTVSKSGLNLVLRWTAVASDSIGNPITPVSYNVYRGTAPLFVPDLAGHTNRIGTPTATNFTDTGALNVAGNLYYRVTAVSASGRESYALSGLGLKTEKTYTGQPGQQNTYWISIPYLSGMPDAQTLVTDLNRGPVPGPVVAIARFDPATQTQRRLRWETGSWMGENFPVVAGEAYAITLQSNLTLVQVGAHNPSLGFNLGFRANNSNIYWVSLPYHADYTDAQSLLQHLNGSSSPTTVAKIVRFDAATGAPESYLYFGGQWLGPNFSILPGQGYAIVLRGDLNGWRPRVVR